MPADQFVCNSCEYESELFLAFRWWERYQACHACQEIVIATCDPYLRLDPHVYLCTRCKGVLDAETDPCSRCPRCHRDTLERHEYLTFMTPDPAPIPYTLEEGRRVHVLRLGNEGGETVGTLAGERVDLTGELKARPGMWWGEGVLTSYKECEISREDLLRAVEENRVKEFVELSSPWVSVDLQRHLEDDPRNALCRLELLYPRSNAPWLAINLTALRRDMERAPYPAFSIMREWLGETPLDTASTTLQRPLDDWSIGSVLSTLLAQPADAHHCLEIHDGQRWHPLKEVDLILKYAESVKVLTAGVPPQGTDDGEHRYEKPHSVEVRREGLTLARWDVTSPAEKAHLETLLGSIDDLLAASLNDTADPARPD